VVSDTEEEFDWSKPHDRTANSVRAMASIGRAQKVFDEYGVRPTYVIDYPVVSQEDGYAPLKEIHADGRCTIGAHLHPWVSPPHEEQVCGPNSFPGNLPASLEEEKLRVIRDLITDVFGEQPVSYKAGRYGIGPHTGAILERLGFGVDLSPQPGFDYRAESGPDFRHYPTGPFWFGRDRRLLSVPSTAALAGFLGPLRVPIYGAAASPVGQKLRLPGILSRLGAVDRLHLSNEGYSSAENFRLTRWLLDRGERVFAFSFHSPTVEPGHTPYVRNEGELAEFLNGFRRYFDYFFGELNGVCMTPAELRDHLAKGAA